MAGIDPDEILVGANSRAYRAPVGTTVGADPAVALSNSWKDLGYTGRDGFEFTPSMDTVDVEVAQDMYTPRKIVTGRALEIGITLHQWNRETLTMSMGGGDFSTTTGVHRYDPPAPEDIDEAAYIFEWADTTARRYRFVVARAMVSSLASFTVGPAINAPLGVTLSALGAGNMLPFYIVSTDAGLAAPA